MNINNGLVNGSLRVIGKLFAGDIQASTVNATSMTATTFNGNLNGNASTASQASRLVTGRSINGTTFDGTANITTANWGTTRTLTIGNSGKSVNGSGNVSWSLAEIGAVVDKANSSGTMDTAATWRNAMGMIALTKADGNINPNNGESWHHFINMSYPTDSSNMWQTQIANKAGTTDLWIRSRAGGKIDGTAWAAPWTRILTGSNYSNVTDGRYVKKSGDTITGTLVLSKTTDAAGTANNSPALIVGGTATQAHIEIDNNEVMAKSNGTTTTDLYLNADGGKVHVGGGGLTVNATGKNALVVGGTAENISDSVFKPTAGIQIDAGTGGATNSTGIGFHNPNISSASLIYKNTDANNGAFIFSSDDTTWNMGIGTSSPANKLHVMGTIYADRGGTSISSIKWNKYGTYWGGIGYHGTNNENWFGPTLQDGTWADHNNETWHFRGLIKSTNHNNTVSIGSQNGNWTHIYNSADIPFIFNKPVWTIGGLFPYSATNTYTLGNSSNRWKALYVGTADTYGSGTKPIYWNAGVPTASSSTVGSSIRPVYLNAGTITQGSYVWNWSGQSGQPTWLWGGNDGTNMYVYNPSNFNVNSAKTSSKLTENAETASNAVGGLTWFNIEGTAGNAINTNDTPTGGWWYVLRNRHTNTSNNFYTDLAIPFNDTSIYYKIVRNNAVAQNWTKVLDSSNYTGYTVTKTGGGASGTWGINVTGSAGSVAWSNVSGRPSYWANVALSSSSSTTTAPTFGSATIGGAKLSYDSVSKSLKITFN